MDGTTTWISSLLTIFKTSLMRDCSMKVTPAFGVSQQVIHSGYTSLSPKQRTLYDSRVAPALAKRHEELEELKLQWRFDHAD